MNFGTLLSRGKLWTKKKKSECRNPFSFSFIFSSLVLCNIFFIYLLMIFYWLLILWKYFYFLLWLKKFFLKNIDELYLLCSLNELSSLFLLFFLHFLSFSFFFFLANGKIAENFLLDPFFPHSPLGEHGKFLNF